MFVEIEDDEMIRMSIQKDLLRRFIEAYFEYREAERQEEVGDAHPLSLAA